MKKKFVFLWIFGTLLAGFIIVRAGDFGTATRYYYYPNGSGVGLSANTFWNPYIEAQSFDLSGFDYGQPNHNFTIKGISVNMTRVGSPGTMYITLQRINSSDVPEGINLSQNISNADTYLNTTWFIRNFTMPDYNLSDEDGPYGYAILFQVARTEAANSVKINQNLSSYNNFSGAAYEWGGASWSELPARDTAFEIWGVNNSQVGGSNCWAIITGGIYIPKGCTYYVPSGSTGYIT